MSEKWIPVADGLPEQAGYYWITIRGNINTDCRMVERAHFDTDFGWNCSNEKIHQKLRKRNFCVDIQLFGAIIKSRGVHMDWNAGA